MFASEHGEKGCFTGTVGAEKMPTRIGMDFPVDVLQDLPVHVSYRSFVMIHLRTFRSPYETLTLSMSIRISSCCS